MNKYLIDLLKESNTIIIPGLGALTVTNSDTGEMMFMPYLQHDDGKLSGFIAEKDGVDELDAKNTIAKYVREIQSELDKGDTVDVYGLGSFAKSSSGDVEFTNWTGSSSAGAAESLENTQEITQEVPEIVEEVVAETPEVSQEIEEVAPEIVAEMLDQEALGSPEIVEEVVAETPEVPQEIEEVAPEIVAETFDQEEVSSPEIVEEVVAETPEITAEIEEVAPEIVAEMLDQEALGAPEIVEEVVAETPEIVQEITPEVPDKVDEVVIETPKIIAEESTPIEDALAAIAPMIASHVAQKTEEIPTTPEVNATSPVVEEKTVVEAKPAAKKPTSSAPVIEKTVIESATSKPTKEKGEKTANGSSSGSKKRGIGFWMLMALLTLLVAGGTYFALNYNELKQHIPFLADEKKSIEMPEANPEMEEVDTGESEEIVEEEPMPEPEELIEEETPVKPKPIEKPAPVASSSGAYHIVSGAFSSIANANRLMESFKSQGLPARVIENNGLNVVCMQSFATSADAKASLSAMKEKAPGAWILHKP